MRDDDGSEAELALILHDHLEDGIASEGVKTGGGLVKEHQFGPGDDGTG